MWHSTFRNGFTILMSQINFCLQSRIKIYCTNLLMFLCRKRTESFFIQDKQNGCDPFNITVNTLKCSKKKLNSNKKKKYLMGKGIYI